MPPKKIATTRLKTEISAISHEGRGIAKIDGKVVFIPFALKGEIVEFEYSAQKSNYNQGKLITILKASNLREKPPCPHFEICGGCALQHMTPSAQIALKQETLMTHFKHFGQGIAPKQILSPIHSKTEGYRKKARLGVRYVRKKDKVLVGFRERNGRFLAELNSCAILHESVGQRLIELQKMIANLSIYASIAQIEVAVDDAKTALIIRHLVPFTAEDLAMIAQFAKAYDFWIYLQPKGPDTVKRFYPKSAQMAYNMQYSLKDFGITIHFKPNDFTQINQEVNQKMVQRAISLLELSKTDTVLDLFSGIGNFSLPLATQAFEVVGVEGDRNMTDRATQNAMINGIDNITFHTANLFDDISSQIWLHPKKYNKLLLDPPRSGAKEICSNIELIAPERIVYIACDPSTLARDGGILVNQKGYSLVSAGVIDMFPHTAHVESMAVFEKIDT